MLTIVEARFSESVGYLTAISLFLTLLLCEPPNLQAQPNEYSFEIVDSLQRSEERLQVVFLHTDWCRFCRQMEAKTFTDSNVAGLLNSAYYFTSFDAESSDDITFAGKKFSYKATGRKTGVHQLAEALGTDENGQLSYPGLVILNNNREIIFRHNGLLGPKELFAILEAGKTAY